MSIADRIAGHLLHLQSDGIGPSTRHAARRALIHGIGVALGGADLPSSVIARRTVTSTGPCTVLGAESGALAEDAAFANGVAAHASYLEDLLPTRARSGGHPGPVVLPAALAMAEEGDVGWTELLDAVAIGYEAVSVIGSISDDQLFARGFRAISTLGPFGAAAAAAVLAGASREQLAGALVLAGHLAGGTTQGLLDGTMEPFLQAGFAARAGITAARLAMAGASSSPLGLEGPLGFYQAFGGRRELELPEPDHRAGFRPAIDEIRLKPFPTCVENQQTLVMAAEGLEAPIAGDRVASVTLRRSPRGLSGVAVPGVASPGPYTTPARRQLSARFTLAATILGRPAADPHYYQGARDDDEALELAGRIDIVVEEDREDPAIEISTTGGDRIVLDTVRRDLFAPDDETLMRDFIRRAGGPEIYAALFDHDDGIDVRTALRILRQPIPA